MKWVGEKEFRDRPNGKSLKKFKGKKMLSKMHRWNVWMAMSVSLLLTGVFLAQGVLAQSQNSSSAFATGGHDVKQPISITSDALEVNQDEKTAIFSGKVDAVQGDLRIRTDQLEVFYKTASDGAADSITRMKATGNVFIISPHETAEGVLADYDVVTRTISLRQNVRLTKGKNVLCGDALDLDLDSGHSLLKGGCKNKGKRKRIQGLFYPKK